MVSSGRNMGIGTLRDWESDGQYIALLAQRKTRPRAAGAPPRDDG
jgi:hypothetical protein